MEYGIRVGTLDELTGSGEEWLVDRATRTVVIAKFFDGFLDSSQPSTEDGPTKVGS